MRDRNLNRSNTAERITRHTPGRTGAGPELTRYRIERALSRDIWKCTSYPMRQIERDIRRHSVSSNQAKIVRSPSKCNS